MSNLFAGIYSGKRVLVTGHTGFKGSWLSLWLSELGADVYGYSLEPPTNPSLFDEARVHDVLAGHVIADVRDSEKLASVINEVQPEMVFHLAAQPLVRLSYAEPSETYEVNVMGTVNLLEAVRKSPSVKVCQLITSDKCYENKEWVYAYRENDPMGGYDPYSNSKGCVELIVSAYRNSFFNPLQIEKHGVSLSSARAGNVIGGGDWALDRIIPDCIRALSNGEAIEIRNPQAIRPWQHVLEPLSGYLWLAAKQWLKPGHYESGWNFGPGGSGNVSVAEIAAQVTAHWGQGEYICNAPDPTQLHEAKFLKLDITKANDLLDWYPACSVKEAVHMTVDWYAAWSEQSDLNSFALKQIAAYGKQAGEQEIAWAVERK